MNSRDILIWLNSLNINSNTIEKLEEYFGSFYSLWEASTDVINNINFISEYFKSVLVKYKDIHYYEDYINRVQKSRAKIITIFDDDYPKHLKSIYNPPKVIYIKGSLESKDEVSIAIVGARKATAYGKWAAEKFAKELASLGITIVSGLAYGIDTKAHEGALIAEGRTIAVLGNGIDLIYPKTNKALFEKIQNNGAIITEYPLGVQPLPYNFPMRNRIISGLSLGVLVVEASKKSGSLITAQMALEQGREVFAIPGNINSVYSKGTNLLIKDGAKLVMDINDIIEEITLLKNRIKTKRIKEVSHLNLGKDEIKIVECIKEYPKHCDEISFQTGLGIKEVNSILTILELKGIVRQLPGKTFQLTDF
ncbi:DNA processing protein [Caloranaerobacter azorensis DSM 13643]|uniref:DNA processing protein n=1 Tax=Caloranaerobacter azorensis DSM 13643 TaxID=1121264 RepID=A0A1M5RNK1_9FIRM|nr:DNA-processing protein DprA [Caloranaerobacter azorensis]SHH27730.1 DNA processing protein [Caloranaerobacter azorensis DSM 13643]